MQYAQPTRGKVVKRALDVAELSVAWSGKRHGDRVDCEVAPQKVLLGGAWMRVREGAWVHVGLAAAPSDVNPSACPANDGRAEALVPFDGVRADGRSDLLGKGLGGVRHYDVQLARPAVEQQIANCTADQLDVISPSGELDQLRPARQLAQAVEHEPPI
jgi:hypothetical protein